MSIVKRFWHHLKDRTRRNFLAGLLITVPLALTWWVVTRLVRFMDNLLAVLPDRFSPDTYLTFRIPGLGVIITLLIIQITGILGANLLGKSFVKSYERILERIPVVRWVYNAVKQLLEQVISPASARFRQAVLIEYPRRGLYSIGFVTGEASGEIRGKAGRSVLNVFVPTTPNPTSGYYIIVPEENAVRLDLSVEQAFKLIISAGMIAPDRSYPGAGDESTPQTEITVKEDTAAPLPEARPPLDER